MTKCIVIGAGQSLYDENVIDVLKKKPDIKILSTDRTLKYVLEQGIIPDYCGIQENLFPATRYGKRDYLIEFFNHDIVKKYANKITLYHSQQLRWTRTKVLNAMGFKMIPFNRAGCGGNLRPAIATCGHCAMALLQIARHILKIDKIATIGMDMDFSSSWKIYEKHDKRTVDGMLSNTMRTIANDFTSANKPLTYNLTKKGSFHGRGVKEITVEEFLNE